MGTVTPDLDASRYAHALSVLTATPALLRPLAASLPDAVAREHPVAEEWLPGEVLNHLLHVETAVIPPPIEAMLAGEAGVPLPLAGDEAAPLSDHKMLWSVVKSG